MQWSEELTANYVVPGSISNLFSLDFFKLLLLCQHLTQFLGLFRLKKILRI